jgi:uncharacterized protein YegP (UPF0339 family)
MKRPKVEVYQREDGLWDWRAIAANGRIVATSGGQGYTSERHTIRGFQAAFAALAGSHFPGES